MKIYILKKSISDIKTPIVRTGYESAAKSVREFIAEMVTRNYKARPVKDALAECIDTASCEFSDGCIYIVNATKNVKYTSLDEDMNLHEGDEIMLIKLKYVRGIIWG